jgi:hypothetical protein
MCTSFNRWQNTSHVAHSRCNFTAVTNGRNNQVVSVWCWQGQSVLLLVQNCYLLLAAASGPCLDLLLSCRRFTGGRPVHKARLKITLALNIPPLSDTY